MGDDAIGDDLKLLEKVGVGALVGKIKVNFFEVGLGVAEGGIVALAESIDREGEGVDAGFFKLGVVLGEILKS